MEERIILFGGTFDPVHIGHTTVVHCAARSLHATAVVFVPALQSPHKSDALLAPVEHRLAMLRLALAEYPTFSISTCELDRPEPSYTYDTVMEFRRQSPAAKLFWLLGADALSSLHRWYRVKDLLDACQVCVMSRGGVDSPSFDALESSLGAAAVASLRQHAIATPLVPVSSTDVRTRLAGGLDCSGMLHPAVLAYVHEHRLYGAAASGSALRP